MKQSPVMRGLALIVAGLLAAGVAALVAVGSTPASAEIVGYDMSADARGVQVFTIIPDQQVQPELDIPQASTTLTSGTGYGLASVAWPGAAVANGATLLPLLIPGFPQSVASMLGYPIRAEARTGQDPPTTVYDVPGLTMRARADTTSSESEAGAQGLSFLPAAFGAARATTSSRAFDDYVQATAQSVVEDLNFGGVLKIQQVVSTATAKSDGVIGSGSASTVVTGATVNNNPVTIDGGGLHFGTTNQPIDAVTSQINQQALNRAGISVAVGPRLNELDGVSSTQGATTIVITMTQNGYTLGYTIGGARATAAAGADDAFVDTGTSFAGTTDVLGATDFAAPTDLLGDSNAFTPTDLATIPTPTLRAPTRVAPATLATAKGRPLSKAAMLFALVASVLFGLGLRRLSGAVLADPTASLPCRVPGSDS